MRQKFPEIPLFSDFRTWCPAMQSNQNILELLQPETFFVFVQIALSESADLCFDLFRCSLGGLCVDMVHWVSWKKPLWVINFAPNWHTVLKWKVRHQKRESIQKYDMTICLEPLIITDKMIAGIQNLGKKVHQNSISLILHSKKSEPTKFFGDTLRPNSSTT